MGATNTVAVECCITVAVEGCITVAVGGCITVTFEGCITVTDGGCTLGIRVERGKLGVSENSFNQSSSSIVRALGHLFDAGYSDDSSRLVKRTRHCGLGFSVTASK